MSLNDWRVMILHSEDGQDYAHAVLYPSAWTPEEADVRAVDAFLVVQAANPEEWNWTEYEPELIARGFLVPAWHHGPTWDRERRG